MIMFLLYAVAGVALATAALGAIFFAIFVFSLGFHDPPTDAEMVARFQRERDTFTRLIALLKERDIPGLVELNHVPNSELAPIRALLTRIGATHLRRDVDMDEVTLVYDASWYAGTGWAKMYAHAPRSDLSWMVVSDLDAGFLGWDKAKPWRAEKPLDGGWVLRLEYSP